MEVSIKNNRNTKSLCRLNDVTIVEIKDSMAKSVYTKEVLEKLPEWFGNKQALDEYVVGVSDLPYWAALNKKLFIS